MKLRKILTIAAALGITGTGALLAETDAHAQLPFSCATINSENMALGNADAVTGYTQGLTGLQTDGSWTLPNADVQVQLPPNGIVCVKSILGQNTNNSRYVEFIRNSANTPVYLLAEDYITLNRDQIRANGSTQVGTTGFGFSRIGGLGGPAGSDGGSCDTNFGSGMRAADGHGPGGGEGNLTSNYGGGGGASPIEDGGRGYFQGGLGGAHPSSLDDVMIHGGSGGGCGRYSNGIYGGSGGGGVIVAATNGTLDTGTVSPSGFAVLGAAPSAGGGAGGGGVIRLVANRIEGYGALDARGGGRSPASSGSDSCGTNSYYGGCGGNGLVRFETLPQNGVVTPNVAGTVISNAIDTNGEEHVRFSVVKPLVPQAGLVPRVEVIGVEATLDGQQYPQAAPTPDPSKHAVERATITVRTGGQVIVTVRTTHVPETATVKVKMNGLQTTTGAAGENVVVNAANPTGTGVTRTWTATMTIPDGSRLGSIEAWVTNVCTPGSPGCAAVQ